MSQVRADRTIAATWLENDAKRTLSGGTASSAITRPSNREPLALRIFTNGTDVTFTIAYGSSPSDPDADSTPVASGGDVYPARADMQIKFFSASGADVWLTWLSD